MSIFDQAAKQARATAYGGGIAGTCVPSYGPGYGPDPGLLGAEPTLADVSRQYNKIESVASSPMVNVLSGLNEQIDYLDKVVSSLEAHLSVLRRPVPEGVEGRGGEQTRASASQFVEGLAHYGERLAIINGRLHRLDSTLDL